MLDMMEINSDVWDYGHLELQKGSKRSAGSNKQDSAGTLKTTIGMEKRSYTVLYIEDNPANLKLIKKANPSDKPRIYAEVGLWYDAVSTLGDLIDTPPKGITLQELRQQRAALLEQVDLEEVAAYDRQAK